MRTMTDEGDDPLHAWTRLIPGQPEHLLAPYIAAEVRENTIRARTARHHEAAITLWLTALHLYTVAFSSHGGFDTDGPEPGVPEETEEARLQRRSHAVRRQILALAGRGSKLALDATLAGYYSEVWTLLRTMIDGWARCAYVRLRPHEYYRWAAAEAQPAAPESPHWGVIVGIISTAGTDTDRVLVEEALLRWKLLQMGFRPSRETVEPIRDDALGLMTNRPEYHEGFCLYSFSLAVFVQRVLLREVELLGGHEDWWLQAHAEFATAVTSLEHHIQPALVEVAARRD